MAPVERNFCPLCLFLLSSGLVHSFSPFNQHVCQPRGVMDANNHMCSLCSDGQCLLQKPGRWHSSADRAGRDQARWAPSSAWKGEQVLSPSQLLPQGNAHQPWPEILVIWRKTRVQLSHGLSLFEINSQLISKINLSCADQTKHTCSVAKSESGSPLVSSGLTG